MPFLEHHTGAPYLIGPNGWYLREPASRKPLVWDLKNGGAVPHDTPGIDPALVGTFTVEAVGVGVDGDLIEHAQAQGQPAHVRLMQHVAARTPPNPESGPFARRITSPATRPEGERSREGTGEPREQRCLRTGTDMSALRARAAGGALRLQGAARARLAC